MKGEEMPTFANGSLVPDATTPSQEPGKERLGSGDAPGWYECENFYNDDITRRNVVWWDGRQVRSEPNDAIRHTDYLRNFRGPLVVASPLSSQDESRDEERQRIRKIKTATCEGCLAAAMGLPLHIVAESGYAARSYCGDAWEQGWEFFNGLATWQQHRAEQVAALTAAREQLEQANRELVELRGSYQVAMEAQAGAEAERDEESEHLVKWTQFYEKQLEAMRQRATTAEAENERLRGLLATVKRWIGDCDLKESIDAALAAKETQA